jgi:hypothetical protein
MAEETVENGMTKKDSSKTKPKLKMNKWIIGLLLLVLVLGGLSVYQFKKNKDLQAKLDKKVESKEVPKPNTKPKEEHQGTVVTEPTVDERTVDDPNAPQKPV